MAGSGKLASKLGGIGGSYHGLSKIVGGGRLVPHTGG